MGDGMLSLAWNNHSSTFCHMLSTLRGMERYTDVTVACEGKFYSVHKLVLASCSDYFLKIFEKTPCKHPVIVLKDIQGKDIEALLSYMYDGVVSVAQNDLARLISAAELLQIKGLAVPDEPPVPSKKSGHTRCSSDDRSSPQQKRPRRDDNNSSSRRQRSRDSSPQSSSSFFSGSEQRTQKQSVSDNQNVDRSNQKASEVREQSNGRKKSHHDGLSVQDKSNQEHMSRESEVMEIKEIIDESEIKEEADDDVKESGFDFEPLDNSSGMKDMGNLDLPVSFNSPTSEQSFDSQAGPSGLQAWPGLHEGEVSSQGYSGDMTLDTSIAGQSVSHPDQPHHLMAGINEVKTTDIEGRTELGNQLGRFNKPVQHHYYSYSDYKKHAVVSHTEAHTGIKPYACPHCPYRAALKGNLNIHMRIHTGEKPYSCSYCQYTTSFKSNLKRHMVIHPE